MTDYEKEFYIIVNGGRKIKDLPRDVFIFNNKDISINLHLTFDEAYEYCTTYFTPPRYLKFKKSNDN
jgi:hypothetical protein